MGIVSWYNCEHDKTVRRVRGVLGYLVLATVLNPSALLGGLMSPGHWS